MIRKRTVATKVRLAVAMAGVMLQAAAANADDITLRSSVRLPVDVDRICLAHIAELEGEEAARLGDLVIQSIKASAGVIELTVRDVRAKLDEAGVNWGRINLSGGKVIVRPARSADAQAPLAMTPVALEGVAPRQAGAREAHSASDLARETTLRGAIASFIASSLGIEPARLRLGFDAADETFLNLDITATRFEIQPLSSVTADQIAITVRTWDAGRVQASRSLTLHPTALVSAAELRRDLTRGETVSEADLERVERWMPIGQGQMLSTHVAAAGRVAERNLKAGDLLRQRDVRSETLVKRGDLVMVRCLVGRVAISLQAEARADGVAGETIEFRKQGERETFLAAVTSRGEAVVDLSAGAGARN